MITTNAINTSRSIKITYWITTGLLALFILSGSFFMNSQFAIDSMHKLGVPEWLRWELNIGHVIGGILLIIPAGNRLKEWTYVAVGIDYISAFIANISTYGSISIAFEPVVTFALLITSYICYHKMHKVYCS